MSELNTAKADLASAQSSLNYQTANFNRYKTLYNKGLVSANDYENALLTYRGKLKRALHNLKKLCAKAQDESQLRYYYITNRRCCTFSKSVEEGQTGGCQLQYTYPVHHC